MRAFHKKIIFAFVIAVTCLAQPLERPPRPGETSERPPRSTPVLDRDYKMIDEIAPTFGAKASVIINPSGTAGAIFGGIRYGKVGLGVELGYIDYEREFFGSKISWMSTGDSLIFEKGSFVTPAVYAEYIFDLGALSIVPRTKIGMADIIARRWYSGDTEYPTRFERKRLINTWELGIRVPVGPVKIAATVDWTALNPWFFFWPEDFGIATAGVSILY